MPRNSAAPKKEESLSALYELMITASSYYYDQMRKSDRAIQYLKSRGISGTIAQQFNIGYAQTGWSHALDTLAKTEADKKKLLDVGLIIKKTDGGYYDRFRDRIMFPIHDYRGRIIGFGGRIIDAGEPKYLNSPETPLFQKGHELYGLYQALKINRKLDRVVIVEGYMDVIALFQHGITYAVATLGTATTPQHLKRLFRYTSEVIFCFDGDEAGRTAAWRALQVILPIMHDSLQIRFLFLPDGEDPDSLVRKESKAAFEKRLDATLSLSMFFFQTLGHQCDMNTMEGRARFAASALSYIKQLPAGLFQSILIEELSKRARINSQELKEKVKNSEEISSETLLIATQEPAKTKLPKIIQKILALLVQHPYLAEYVQEPLTHATPAHLFLSQLIALIKSKPNLTTGTLLEYFRGQKEETFIAKLAQFQHMVPDAGIKDEFCGSIRQLISQGTEEAINNLLAKAAQNGLSDEEKVELTTLINKKKNLVPVIQS